MNLENTRTTVENIRPSSPDFTRMQARRKGKQHQTSNKYKQRITLSKYKLGRN